MSASWLDGDVTLDGGLTRQLAATVDARDSLASDSPLDAPTRSGGEAPPERIGRYLVLRMLGAGAMGVVYAAYDPELDRKVAIKLIRRASADSELARQRMIREAQALAKVVHPNVIAVYDVGTFDDRVFIAMEYVAGRDLGAWLAQTERRLDELLPLFMQAGRGLAAAHEVGLIHRDFKPDNVLVGDEGRVRVVDFGLARGIEGHADDLTDSAAEPLRPHALIDELTQAGALLGTPLYMPPERLHGQVGDGRSDQFSFAVALWDAVYGRRPFSGKTVQELFLALLEGRLIEPPAQRRAQVPERIERALRRALAIDPTERFATMHELLAALEPPVARARTRYLGSGLAGALLLGAAFWTVVDDADTDDRQALCSGFEAHLAGKWDAARRAEIAAVFDASELSYAERSRERVLAALDDWAGEWLRTRQDACAATHLRGEQSGELLDRKMACLDRELAELGAFVDVLARGEAEVIEQAGVAVDHLPELERCAELELGEQLDAQPDPPSDSELAAQLARALDRLEAEQALGVHAGMIERTEALTPELRSLAYPPLLARQTRLLGQLRADDELLEPALAASSEALALARRSGDAQLVAATLLDLLDAMADQLDYADEFDRWALLAEAEIARLEQPLLEARLRVAQGRASWERGEYERANTHLDRALALRLAELGPDHLAVADVKQDLAMTIWTRGDLAAARALHAEVEAIYVAQLGPDHPKLSALDNDIGAVAWMAGDHDAALERYHSALARTERVFGPDHPRVSRFVMNIGATLAMQGELEQARPHFERALELDRRHDTKKQSLIITLGNLAELELLLGKRERARALLEEARDLRLATLGERHPDYARSLIELALFDLDEAKPEAARVRLEQAIALREGVEVHQILRARAHWHLARAYAALAEPRERIVEQLDAARADFAASKVALPDELARFEADASALLR